MMTYLTRILASTLIAATFVPMPAVGAPQAPSTLSPDDTRYWLKHSRDTKGDRARLARIARAFAGAPLPDGWRPNQPSSTMAIWDFDGDGLLEAYTNGEAIADRDRHALLMAEQQADGSWTTRKVADIADFTLIRLTIVNPGEYRTSCNNCSAADGRDIVLDRTGMEYRSGYVRRYFAPGQDGLIEVTDK